MRCPLPLAWLALAGALAACHSPEGGAHEAASGAAGASSTGGSGGAGAGAAAGGASAAAGGAGAAAGGAGGAGGASGAGAEADVAWAVSFGGPGADAALGSAVDAGGNVYVVGVFAGEMTVGETTLLASGPYDGFVAKLDPSGAPLWARRFGGAGVDTLWSCGVDDAGNVYVGGVFGGQLAEGASPIDSALGQGLSWRGGYDWALARLTPDGETVWCHGYGGPGDDGLSSVRVDGAGTVTASAMMGENCEGHPCDAGGGQLGGSWSTAVLQIVDSVGNHLFSRDWSAGNTGGTDSLLDAAPAGASGLWALALTTNAFLPEKDQAPLPWSSDAGPNVALMRLDEGRHVTWARAFDDPGLDYSRGLAVDSKGAVLVPFAFEAGSVDLGGGPLMNHGLIDGALALYEPDGSLRWGQVFGGPLVDAAFGAAFDGQDEAYVAIYYSATADLLGMEAHAPQTPGSGLLKVGPSGEPRWVLPLGTGVLSQEPIYSQVSADRFHGEGVVYTGRFVGSFSLGAETKKSSGNSDALVVRVRK